jgi:hypothetical protein
MSAVLKRLQCFCAAKCLARPCLRWVMNGRKATCALSPFDSQLRTLVRASRRSHSYSRHQSRRLIWSGGRSAKGPPGWSKWSPLPACYAGSHRAHVLSPQGFPADRHPLRRPSLALLSTAIRRSKKCAVRAALQRTDAARDLPAAIECSLTVMRREKCHALFTAVSSAETNLPAASAPA